jgi:lipid-binding SYLF domain-containing protein
VDRGLAVERDGVGVGTGVGVAVCEGVALVAGDEAVDAGGALEEPTVGGAVQASTVVRRATTQAVGTAARRPDLASTAPA